MALPGLLSIADSLATMPAGTNRTNFTNALTTLQSNMTTATGNGGMTANQAAVLFEDLLLDFAQRLANNCKV